MEIIDIIIIIAFIPAIYKGVKNGFISQIAGIGSLFLGVYLAYRFSSFLSPYISEWIKTSENIIKIISFSIIIIAVIVLVNIVGRIIKKIVSVVMLSWLDKILGLVLSIGTASLIVGLILCLITYINETWFVILPNDIISKSKLFVPLSDFANTLFPYLKNFFIK